TGILSVRRHSDVKILKIADLVRVEGRHRIVEYLRNTDDEDDMYIIIALGMVKEGFDCPYCEHALTIGYPGSLTEIGQ
ncbi:DEAD/DEAH box helicase, partial [Enterococcus faecalis]